MQMHAKPEGQPYSFLPLIYVFAPCGNPLMRRAGAKWSKKSEPILQVLQLTERRPALPEVPDTTEFSALFVIVDNSGVRPSTIG